MQKLYITKDVRSKKVYDAEIGIEKTILVMVTNKEKKYVTIIQKFRKIDRPGFSQNKVLERPEIVTIVKPNK